MEILAQCTEFLLDNGYRTDFTGFDIPKYVRMVESQIVRDMYKPQLYSAYMHALHHIGNPIPDWLALRIKAFPDFYLGALARMSGEDIRKYLDCVFSREECNIEELKIIFRFDKTKQMLGETHFIAMLRNKGCSCSHHNPEEVYNSLCELVKNPIEYSSDFRNHGLWIHWEFWECTHRDSACIKSARTANY